MNETQVWTDIPVNGPLLTLNEVSERVGLSRSHIYALIQKKQFPPLLRVGERASRLPEPWLRAFLEQRAAEAIAAA